MLGIVSTQELTPTSPDFIVIESVVHYDSFSTLSTCRYIRYAPPRMAKPKLRLPCCFRWMTFFSKLKHSR